MSLFQLDSQPTGPRSANGGTDHYFHRVTPTSNGRIVPGQHMSKQGSQQLDFRFSPSGTDWWVPSKSYFRIRVRCKQRRARTYERDSNGVVIPGNPGTPFVFGPHVASIIDVGALNPTPKGQQIAGGDPVAMAAVFDKMKRSELNPSWTQQEEALIEAHVGRVRPARGFCASMFDTAAVKVGDTIVSKISDDLLHQIDVFRKRTSSSSAFLNGSGNYTGLYASKDDVGFSSVGVSKDRERVGTDNHGADSRLRVLTIDGTSGYAELMWQPPLGIFDYDRALPPSTFDIQLKTRAGNLLHHCLDYELFRFTNQYGVDLVPDQWVDALTQDGPQKLLDWGLEEIYFYAAIVQGPEANDAKYALDLRETSCIARQLGSGSGPQTHNFDVDPNTSTIGFAIQGRTPWMHGSDGEFRSGLRPFNLEAGSALASVSGNSIQAGSGTQFVGGSEVRNLGYWYVSYDSKQYPSEHSEQDIKGPANTGTDDPKVYITQRWFDTVSQAGTHYMSSGAETLKEWLAGGAIYFMTWPRIPTANATRLMLTLQIKDGATEAERLYLGRDHPHEGRTNFSDGESVLANQARVLLFTQHSKAFLIRTTDSRVVQVETPLNGNPNFRSLGN